MPKSDCKFFVKFLNRKWTNAVAGRYHKTVSGETAGLGTIQATLSQPANSGVNARMRQNRISMRADAFYAVVLLGAGLLALSGCGDGKLPLCPVTGSVLVDGKPAEGAMVIFCPEESSSSPELQRERPFGTTGPDGKFLVTTFHKEDGIPVGQYKVLVQWNAPGAAYDERTGNRDRLRGKYMNLQTTPLSATIAKDTLELAPFDLKSR
jgi:hypothetical protein